MLKYQIIKENLKNDVGAVCPIIVSLDGYILDGNNRVTAARNLGIETLPGVVIPVKIENIVIKDLKITWKVETGEIDG